MKFLLTIRCWNEATNIILSCMSKNIYYCSCQGENQLRIFNAFFKFKVDAFLRFILEQNILWTSVQWNEWYLDKWLMMIFYVFFVYFTWFAYLCICTFLVFFLSSLILHCCLHLDFLRIDEQASLIIFLAVWFSGGCIHEALNEAWEHSCINFKLIRSIKMCYKFILQWFCGH